VINTWDKPTWKASKGFTQVILSIQAMSLLEHALDGEPPHNYSTSRKKESDEYNEIVRFSCQQSNTYKMYQKMPVPEPVRNEIRAVMKRHLQKHHQWFIKKLTALIAAHQNELYSCGIYHTTDSVRPDYKTVLDDFKKFCVEELEYDEEYIGKLHREARTELVKETLNKNKTKLSIKMKKEKDN